MRIDQNITQSLLHRILRVAKMNTLWVALEKFSVSRCLRSGLAASKGIAHSTHRECVSASHPHV